MQRLQQAAEHRERSADRYLAEAQRLLDAGQLGPACRAIERARAENPKAAPLLELEAQIVQRIMDQLRDAADKHRDGHHADVAHQFLLRHRVSVPSRQQLLRA